MDFLLRLSLQAAWSLTLKMTRVCRHCATQRFLSVIASVAIQKVKITLNLWLATQGLRPTHNDKFLQNSPNKPNPNTQKIPLNFSGLPRRFYRLSMTNKRYCLAFYSHHQIPQIPKNSALYHDIKLFVDMQGAF